MRTGLRTGGHGRPVGPGNTMFGSIGGPELLLIFVIALLIFGPKKLSELGRALGKGMAEFRKAATDLRETLDNEVARSESTPSRPSPDVEATQAREMAAPPDAANQDPKA